MDCHPEESGKEARSRERLPVQCSIAIANGIQIGQGKVFDVSVRGCFVEGSVLVKVGDGLQLRLSLPEAAPDPSICVSLAVVRWVEGPRFGVEFIRVDEKYRARLNRFITLQSDPWARAYD